MPPINEQRLEELFLKLCSINSPSLNEQDVVAWMKRHLQDLGLEVSEDDAGARIGGKANNIIAWLRGTIPSAPKVFLSAHFDTVEPTENLTVIDTGEGWKTDETTILGADDKGGMAPAIEAVLALRESGLPHGDVCLLLSVAEEIGLKGAAAVKIEELGLDFGYVLDTGPPVGTYVNRTATHDKLEITVIGRPAHAGKDPENGINAIQVLSDAVSGMRLGRIDPETTANLGIIQGGTAVNVVCPSVTVRAEARSVSVESLDRQIAHMIERFEASARKFGAEVKIDHARHYKSYLLPENSILAQIGKRASESLGLAFALRTTLGGSDANVYNSKGLPCLVMATGIEKIHTHQECITKQSLHDTARLALAVLLESAKETVK